MDARQRRISLIAAWINGALVTVALLGALLAWRPEIAERLTSASHALPLLYVGGAFGLLAGWRTYVHSVAYVEHQSSGWLALLEPTALSFAIAAVLFSNAITADPAAAVQYILRYGSGAAAIGLGMAIVLRFTAIAAIRLFRQ